MSFAILTGVLMASIVGSVHCIAMCGPLVGLHGGVKTLRLSLVHSLGRLTTYVVLGALAGLVGSAIDVAGQLGNVQRIATILAAVVIVGIAVVPLFRKNRGPAKSPFTAALVRIRPRSAAKRAWLIGTLTGLLPCGWLWAFVVMAAGSASVLSGAAIMGTFWLGTAPAMIGLVRFAGPLVAKMRERMPALTAIVLVTIGLGTLAMRWRDAGTSQVQAPHCHCHDHGAKSS
jgi:sulfite exporter TauE/SafE